MYFKIDTNKLISTGLLIESYFLLECLHKADRQTLESYVDHCGKFSKLAIDQLVSEGYIENIIDSITFSNLKLTKQSIRLLGNNKIDTELFFKEFKSEYLTKTPCGRRLHTDPGGCKVKYKNLITSEEQHRTILKCVKIYFNELRSTGKLDFAQAMPAWLNQKNYKVYWEDALKSEVNSNGINDNLENRTTLGSTDF